MGDLRAAAQAVETTFWSRVDRRGPNECWSWLGPIRHRRMGYGGFSLNGRMQLAHRVAYALVKGDISDGLQIDHLCRNGRCVNPDHLEAVDNRTNVLRGDTITAANAAKTACIHGHLFDAENTRLRPDGKRDCRQCQRDSHSARRRFWPSRGKAG